MRGFDLSKELVDKLQRAKFVDRLDACLDRVVTATRLGDVFVGDALD